MIWNWFLTHTAVHTIERIFSPCVAAYFSVTFKNFKMSIYALEKEWKDCILNTLPCIFVPIYSESRPIRQFLNYF